MCPRDWKKSVIFSMLALLAVSVAGASLLRAGYWTQWDGKIRISNVTREETITLSGEGEIVGLSVRITGSIDGTAVLEQSYKEKKMYTYPIGPGKVHLSIGGDWYANECLLTYKPRAVTSGALEVKYRFRRL